jgi:DNA polymerase III epsilon subunit-like protein
MDNDKEKRRIQIIGGQMKVLFFDTETTGVPKNYNAPHTDSLNWPRVVQLAWARYDFDDSIKQPVLRKTRDFIIKPTGFEIPIDVSRIHGITTEIAMRSGSPLSDVLEEFCLDVEAAGIVVAHNISFDAMIIAAELHRLKKENIFQRDSIRGICTMKRSTQFCAIPKKNSNPFRRAFGNVRPIDFKWPTLSELHTKLFGQSFQDAHNALADIEACASCFFELVKRNIIKADQ